MKVTRLYWKEMTSSKVGLKTNGNYYESSLHLHDSMTMSQYFFSIILSVSCVIIFNLHSNPMELITIIISIL